MTTPLTCPCCDADRVVPVLYGEPSVQPANDEQIGGCVVAVDSPRWHCRACGHLWGKLGSYDFENLAELLATAVAGAMWSMRSEYQSEGLADLLGELEQLGAFIDDDAEAARRNVLTARALWSWRRVLGGDFRQAAREMVPRARDGLASHLVYLLRYAERKAANG